ncbi:MAG TPA: nicotinate phosphoribosyltransferase [Candidatus Binatia bacterium]
MSASSEPPYAADVALLTDLYELTMAASYVEHDLDAEATFDLFVRALPPERAFLVACGLERALDYLETLRFDEASLAYLDGLGIFRPAFLDRLARLRFTGEVWAIPEGEVCFANEPLLRLTGPLVEVQIVETFLLNCVGFQTMIASKAARVALACGERRFVDFSARRDHGADAAVEGARAACIGGAVATSNVLAGKRYGLALAGTMAHSYVMSFASEYEAFRTFARDFPKRSTLLIDTYDTEEGARVAARVASELRPEGITVQGVRLDSGDLLELSRSVRRILDDAGHPEIEIFASGDLDEHAIAKLLAAGAPIDAFGVGTKLGTSHDAPSLSVVYKLVEDVRGPKIKLSTHKMTAPGRKQVYRVGAGEDAYDVIALADEPPPSGGRPLLERVLADGRRLRPRGSVDEARERRRAAVERLPARLRSLAPVEEPYPVRRSAALEALIAQQRERAATTQR